MQQDKSNALDFVMKNEGVTTSETDRFVIIVMIINFWQYTCSNPLNGDNDENVEEESTSEVGERTKGDKVQETQNKVHETDSSKSDIQHIGLAPDEPDEQPDEPPDEQLDDQAENDNSTTNNDSTASPPTEIE